MKSEKQKMLAGELYDASDATLVNERLHARKLMREFNDSDAADMDKRVEILKRLIVVKGNVEIEPPFYCDYGYNIEVGDRFFANFDCVMLDVNKIHIGNNVMFGPKVQVYTATHPIKAEERIKGPERGLPITIGDNVWIGGGSIICPNVTIGNNTTIGAGSVVTQDIPANVFAVGNPCRVVKEL